MAEIEPELETPEDHVYLQGLALRYYRGIGEATQYIAPFSKLNFFVGPNNAGKSIVLNFLAEHLPMGRENDPRKIHSLQPERFRGERSGDPEVGFGCNRHTVLTSQLRRAVRYKVPGSVEAIFDASQVESLLWVRNVGVDGRSDWRFYGKTRDDAHRIFGSWLEGLPPVERDQFSRRWDLAQPAFGAELEHFVSVAKQSLPLNTPTALIPSKREIGPAGRKLVGQSGEGLIDELAKHQNPTLNEPEKRDLFRAINRFLQTVTDRPDAQIEVPHDREHLLVHMDGKTLPLSNLGTGIHEVILIAAFCTLKQDQIICIEEPEIHLHPILQRKLIRYLMEHTTNQYFIATHSAALIDTPDASVFRVTNDGTQTRIRHAISPSDRGQICDDLGYLASDILQANFVIWVEGPSDRIYLRHWIKAYRQRVGKPEFIEGVHYTIMFYGGGLLSHLSADAEEVEDFIKLRQINRNMAVVMDSDKSGPSAKIGAAKLRIKAKMSDDPSLAWITKGREIENYLPFDLLQAKAKDIHSGSYGEPGVGGIYDHAFKYVGKDKKIRDCDKVKLAHAICAEAVDWSVLDLEARVASLVAAIEKANGKEAA